MENNLAHQIPGKLRKTVGADMFTLNDTNYLHIVDYHSKFLTVKRTEELVVDDLIKSCKITFAKYRLPRKIMSDTGTNSISEKLQTFCRKLKIYHVASYHTITRVMDKWNLA